MRRFAVILMILLAFALPVSAGVGVWTPLGPDGGEVFSLAADSSDPEIAYAATAAGLYKTSDRGQSWSQIRREFAYLLGLAGDTLYVDFIFDQGRMRTTDGGQTWTPASNLPQHVSEIVADPRLPNRVWAAGLVVHLSDDGGDTWRPLARPKASPKEVVSGLAFDPAGTWVYVAFTNAVYRSADQGKTWQRCGQFGGKRARVRHLVIDAGNPSILYAATDTGLFRSQNRGNKWQQLGTPAFKGAILDILSAGGRVFASVEGSGIFYSSDRGGTWNRAIGTPTFSGQLAAAAGVLYVATTPAIGEPGGPFRSLDRGATWERVSEGLRSQTVHAVAVHPADPDVLYVGGNGGLQRTTDRGATWETVDMGILPRNPPFSGFHKILIDPPSIYALGDSSWSFRSDDNGETWKRFQSFPAVFEVVPDPRQPGALWGSYQGLFHSDDRGEHWTLVGGPGGELSSLYLYDIRVDPRDPRILYVAGHTIRTANSDPASIRPRLFRSADGGVTWQRRDTGIEAEAVIDLVLDPAAPDTLYAGTNTGLFRSTDAGQTWTLSGIDGWAEQVVAAPTSPTTLYADVDTVGVHRSSDGGQTWTLVDEGLEGELLYGLTVDPNDPDRLYAGVLDRGLFTYERP